MSTLQLVYLPLKIPALHRWAAQRGCGWSKGKGVDGHWRDIVFDEGRALHHLLVELFGQGALKPFRLLVASGGRNGTIYAYSSRDAADLLEMAQDFATPDLLNICNLENLATKPMPEEWRVGRRLGFDLRIRPVRRLANDCGGIGRGAEVDAFLAEALRRFPFGAGAEENMERAGRTREAVYADWLAERLGGAAEIRKVHMVRFSRTRAVRGAKSLEGPDATLHGELIVADSTMLNELLCKGVGRHGAYGYGMMLLRPPVGG
ncbi:MAG: type I-E CRISPR-associated protein Cas6/Cse3/CasE [Desulfurivibrio sp.]|nr:type I-E CRISPR-associated protein Cas6/Cse3/CasE [Desulfurivibrio sp.]